MSVKDLNATGNRSKENKVSKTPSSQINLATTKKNFIDIKALIRSIQRAEGDSDCFRSGIADCDQVDCKWHHICLEGQHVSE